MSEKHLKYSNFTLYTICIVIAINHSFGQIFARTAVPLMCWRRVVTMLCFILHSLTARSIANRKIIVIAPSSMYF